MDDERESENSVLTAGLDVDDDIYIDTFEKLYVLTADKWFWKILNESIIYIFPLKFSGGANLQDVNVISFSFLQITLENSLVSSFL